MEKTKYYVIEPEQMTEVQEICANGRFGLYRNLLKMFGPMSFHILAARVLQYKEWNNEPMITETELGYSILRLFEEGLIGIDNVGACNESCCSEGVINES